jgi:hypothetical protein
MKSMDHLYQSYMKSTKEHFLVLNWKLFKDQ